MIDSKRIREKRSGGFPWKVSQRPPDWSNKSVSWTHFISIDWWSSLRQLLFLALSKARCIATVNTNLWQLCLTSAHNLICIQLTMVLTLVISHRKHGSKKPWKIVVSSRLYDMNRKKIGELTFTTQITADCDSCGMEKNWTEPRLANGSF